MNVNLKALIERQNAIADDELKSLDVPRYSRYAICNLRGGIGKTSLTFNLSYLTDELLVVDTCPQGNLSYFLDETYFNQNGITVYDTLLPYFMPGLGHANRVARSISASNKFFQGKNSFYIPSSENLYILPSQMANAIVQAKTIPGVQQSVAIDNMLYSLRKEIDREIKDANLNKCLIDTSPFFSGGTHLSWLACDALIVPVRTDQQSINSLSLLLNTLSSPASEFRRTLPSDGRTPTIQMIVLTHCGWSTRAGARNEPNQQTLVFVEKIRDIVSRNIGHFSTNNPDNHIVLLDDFLGSGRISSALSKPIELLEVGETRMINRVKTEVNAAVDKIKKQLKFINNSIWG